MSIKIALAGNPNSGKTTMFNDLTGSSQYVGNWPGVTVEKKEGKLRGQKDVVIQDLPGIYSLSPYTLEEVVSRNYLITEKPDAIINIVDSSNIERNLYLTTQLVELGLPVVIALNMIDVVRKNGDSIDVKKLSAALGCEIVETSALKGLGTKEVADRAVALANGKKNAEPLHTFGGTVEHAIAHIEDLIRSIADPTLLRWYSIKLFERDEKVTAQLSLNGETLREIEKVVLDCETELDDDCESIITNERYSYISKLMETCVKKHRPSGNMTVSDKIDRIVTNRILALPIFVIIMGIVYYISVSTVGDWATGWVNDSLFGEIIPPAVDGLLASWGTAPWLHSLILDGIIGGVGAVLGFLPQMLVLFFFLAILEDCGYMARIAFIMDRIFRKFGLSGKSFIPILIGTGCGVPGIMASRTIENESDRRMTIITTTFIPCGAKLPIIALIAGALFDNAGWVATSAYFLGIGAIITSGVILKKFKTFAGDPAPFVMELPAYHVPGAKGVLIHMWDRAKSFVEKAGSIIFISAIVVWFLSTFNWSIQMVDTAESMLSSIGGVIAPIFAPLGFGTWEASVATLTGLVAKENLVGTFGILYGFAEVAEDGVEYWAKLQAAFTPLAAYSMLVFNLLCAPCFAAMGAIKREMGSGKLTWFAIGYQTVFAYIVSLAIYQIGTLISTGIFTFGSFAGILVTVVFLYLLFRPNPANRRPKVYEAKASRAA
ncbi:MAG TPA: ferrous iron transport protein B [Feifaniaceae bacterium]|nr:ferrous iron transport protein B [Feifaniaceae bacterium]